MPSSADWRRGYAADRRPRGAARGARRGGAARHHHRGVRRGVGAAGGPPRGALPRRRAAHEAGHSPGSLRHYFPRQERLIEAVLAEVTQVAAARLVPLVVALEGAGRDEVVDAACALLEGLLPLDATRATEWSVWSTL